MFKRKFVIYLPSPVLHSSRVFVFKIRMLCPLLLAAPAPVQIIIKIIIRNEAIALITRDVYTLERVHQALRGILFFIVWTCWINNVIIIPFYTREIPPLQCHRWDTAFPIWRWKNRIKFIRLSNSWIPQKILLRAKEMGWIFLDGPLYEVQDLADGRALSKRHGQHRALYEPRDADGAGRPRRGPREHKPNCSNVWLLG